MGPCLEPQYLTNMAYSGFICTSLPASWTDTEMKSVKFPVGMPNGSDYSQPAHRPYAELAGNSHAKDWKLTIPVGVVLLI